MTQQQLTRLGTKWQRRLRLQDWDVDYTFAPREEIDADAQTVYNVELKWASIRICTEETRLKKFNPQPPSRE